MRLELEFENELDRKRRARLTETLEPTTGNFRVSDGERVPRRSGSFVRLGREWMEVMRLEGDRLFVRRGMRGTDAVPHAAGELIHFGATVVTEIPVRLYSDDWNL